MKYVVGLGNPGKKYSYTRHNLGWMVLERIATRLRIKGDQGRWHGRIAVSDELVLLKPTTYVNRSGRAVAALLEETGAAPENVLIVVDDFNLELGHLRLRRRGASGGHRGLESVAKWLGTEAFPRLRVGVGSCLPEVDPRVYVLEAFAPEESLLAKSAIDYAAQAVLCWQSEGLEEAMNRYNGSVEPSDALSA